MEQAGNGPDSADLSHISELARERLEDPTLLSESLDALMQHLAPAETLRNSLEHSMARQAELYHKSLQLRDRGGSLSKEEQTELDLVNETILGLQRLSESYPSDK